MPHQEHKDVRKKHQKSLLAKRNVVSCGLGMKKVDGQDTGEPCIIIGVQQKIAKGNLKKKDIIPKEIDGIKTDVIELGKIKALQGRTERGRPSPCGVSAGHVDITAGTLGCLVTRDGETYMLSNNHVFANSNEAEKGDSILQPGRIDGGGDTDQIGTLSDYVVLDFGQEIFEAPHWGNLEWLRKLLCSIFGMFCGGNVGDGINRVDAAIAAPLGPEMVHASIMEIGPPTGSAEAHVGTPVKKHGRTTGFTQGEILQEDLTVQVEYGKGKVATFEDQLLAGDMSAGGDSGSAVLNNDNKVVGLLFAGSEAYTIINPIQHVLSDLSIEILV